MIQLNKTKEGLKLHHTHVLPLFEKTYIPPTYGDQLISRLYQDGSLYYLSPDRSLNENDSEQRWNFISFISEKGVNEILSILEKFTKTTFTHSTIGTYYGTIIWKIPFEGQIKEFVIPTDPSDKSQLNNEIDILINTNIQPIPRG